jgi:uncharacterized membrane protein
MRTRLWLLILLLWFGAAARLYHLESQSIWFDEGWSAFAAVQPTLRAAVEADATNPPLYYVLLNIAVRGSGDSEFSLRYFSLLFGLLAVPLSYQLARRLFSPRVGIGSAFLVAISPLMWWASQEARMYTLLAVFVLIAALAWHQLQRRPTRLTWIGLWSSELALLYAHNTGPVIVLWLSAVTIIAWIIRLVCRRYLHISAPRQWKRSEIITWFAGQILVLLLWSPWFITHFLLLPEANSALRAAPHWGLELLGQLWGALWLGSWTMVIRPEADIAAYSSLALLLTAIASALLIPWRKPAVYWLIAHIVILTGGLILGLGILGNEMHGRYLVMIAPLLLTLIGAGLAEGIVWVGTRYALSLKFGLRLAAATLFLIVFLGSLHFASQNPAYQHDDARGMVRYYADHLSANDTVLAWSYADRYDLAYYWDRLGVQAHRTTLPEGADLDRIMPLLPFSGDVALNIWYTQRADYRGMMGCLLGDGTINLPEQISFYGMTNELYRSLALHLPELRPFKAAVSNLAQVTAVGAITSTTADKALCLPLQLHLLATTGVDLKAALIVQNSLGWEIAREDAIFADAAERTTSALEPGDSLTAYPLLRLPYGTPPGNYSIVLRVYDEREQPSGYDLLADNGTLPLRDLPLGTWKVILGAEWSRVNRPSGLPINRDLPVGDLILLADDIQGGTFRNGDEIRLSLLWRGQGAFPNLTLVGENDSWQVAIPASVPQRDDVTLDWRTARIPLEASSGHASLHLPDGTILATYTIESLPALYDPPEFDAPVNASFSRVGTLVGYSLSDNSLDRNLPFDVTLVWHADQTPAASYTVFVQLLDDSGQVIAQSDAIPAENMRPTNGWRPGEYIVDVQHVTFHADAQPARARLIAGLYDATTGVRVMLTSGGDFAILQDDLPVR